MINTDELTNSQVDTIIDVIIEELAEITYRQGNYRFNSFYDINANLVDGEFIVTLEKQLDYLPDVELYTTLEEDSLIINIDALYYKNGVTLWDTESSENYYKVIRKHNAAMGMIEFINGLDIYLGDIK